VTRVGESGEAHADPTRKTANHGFTVIAVALDESPDDVRPWTEGITFPVLIDREHLLSELYAISNVPTVIWIDEEDRIVRPNGVAFGTDLFKEFTGVEAGPHLDLIRRWVREGVEPDADVSPSEAVADLSDDEVLAGLHFRVAVHARRAGNTAAASRHFGLAGELAPHDWTIRRAAMPLVGDDPFGEKFFTMYQDWEAAGKPYHGLPGVTAEPSGPQR
jgi:hypothetical protein